MSHIKKIIIFVLMSALLLALTSCEKNKLPETVDGINIYYINEEGTALVSKKYKLTGKNRDERVKEVISELKKTEIKYKSAIDGRIIINEAVVENRKLNIKISDGYNELSTLGKTFFRTAMVLSLTEINGVDYVEFSVGNEPLRYNDGTSVGPLSAADFVDINSNDINNYSTQKFNFYFSNVSGDALRKVNIECTYPNNISTETFILEQLIKGAEDENYKSPLSADTKVNSVNTKDGVCYVDLSEAIITDGLIDEEVSVYAIVNSLSELAYISKVQISVNGSTDVSYGSIDLSKPLSRNLDIVENNFENRMIAE